MENLHSMVRAAMGLAQQGVLFDHKQALCPECSQKMRTLSTRKEGTATVRWHKCHNPACVLASMALLVKSVESR